MAAVGTVVKSRNTWNLRSGAILSQYQWVCTTQSGTGAVSDNGAEFVNVTGEILAFEAVPDVTATPTAAYDVTIVDANGVDVLMGAGANLTTTGDRRVPLASTYAPVYLFDDSIEPVIANGGDEKITTLRLLVRHE